MFEIELSNLLQELFLVMSIVYSFLKLTRPY